MPVNTIYVLGESQITVSGGQQLSGLTQGDGGHLVGQTITLNSNAWETVDVNDTAGDTNFDDSDNSQTLSSAQTLDGTGYANGARVEAEYELLLRDPDGNEYRVLGFNVNEGGGGASYATVEGLAFVGGVGGFPPRDVPLTVVSATEGPSVAYTGLATPPCFTVGTLIETPTGPVTIADLARGDMVCTLDHGPQPIRWTGHTLLPAAALARHPEFRPVRIARDAFGPGRPYRDTALSPQHRVLIDDWRAALYYGEDGVLVAVKKLVNNHSVTVAQGGTGVTYHHIAFDRHEVIWGDGLPSESYLAGSADEFETRAELAALFPDLAAPHVMRTARPCIADKRCALLRSLALTCRETAPAAFR